MSDFLSEIYVAHAICNKCGNEEFIVDGQTQVCNNCRELIYRDEVKKYKKNNKKRKDKKVGKIIFPSKILIGIAKCNHCNYEEFVVVKDKILCQYCMNKMSIEKVEEYFI